MAGSLLISILLASAAPAEPLAEFERTLAAQDVSAASRIVDDMVLARPRGPLKPDPLLSGLEGRMLLMRAPPPLAPPGCASTSGEPKMRLRSSTSSQARR